MALSFSIGEMDFLDHYFSLPLDYLHPEKNKIQVFAREVFLRYPLEHDRPYLLYLQGGPGFESPRPTEQEGWLKEALQHYRVILLDQRGTGLSTPLSAQTLSHMSPEDQTTYLCHFRADNIVRDAEQIRIALKIERWSLLGQSFGGFCALTYLSFYPDGLNNVFITGGVAGIERSASAIYRKTYRQLLKKNKQMFDRFPTLQEQCQRIADHLLKHEIRLPNGQPLTVRQLQLLGIALGSTQGDIELFHLLHEAFISVQGQFQLSYHFLNAVQQRLDYLTHPLFAILHEAIYCQQEASNWAAERVRNDFPELNYQSGQPFLFTGEMIYPWMFEELQTLKPLRQTALLLASKSDWPLLYDIEQLQRNRVPIVASCYVEDMYVPLKFSRETLEHVQGAKAWITNEYEHDGLRTSGGKVFAHLHQMLRHR